MTETRQGDLEEEVREATETPERVRMLDPAASEPCLLSVPAVIYVCESSMEALLEALLR